MKHLKSPGVILGIIAVILAVAGTATAASLITGANVKDGSLTGADVKNGSLTSKDLSAATVKGLSGQDGTNGAKGDTGATGATGPKGDTGATGATGPKGDTGAAGNDGAAGADGAQGPAGPAGAVGPKGGDGTNGTNGTDGIVNVTQDGGTVGKAADVSAVFNDYKGGSLVRDLAVPAGSYDIEATMSVRGPDDTASASPNYVRCNLSNKTDNSEIDTFYRTFRAPDLPNPGDRVPLNIGALVTFAVPTTVEVRCYTYRSDTDPAGHAGSVPSSKLIATEVQSITTQP